MSQPDPSGFAKFVPGFDFLQNLGKHASPTLGAMNNWVAPTMDPQELDKRISELKAVQFWLDQNATALKATIQALEVQKMTLATLKGMNLDMGAMAKSFKFPTQATPSAEQPAAKAAPQAAPQAKPATKARSTAAGAPATGPAVDPLQLWGALSQQFQQIATDAMQEVAKHAANAPKTGKAASAAAAAPSAKSKPSTAAKPAAKPAAKKTARRAR